MLPSGRYSFKVITVAPHSPQLRHIFTTVYGAVSQITVTIYTRQFGVPAETRTLNTSWKRDPFANMLN
jgi:hypothetical protein